MRRYCFLLVMLAGLLAGCASKGAAQPAEVRALAGVTLTSSPENSSALAEGSETAPYTPPTSCPVTVSQEPPFIAPVPYSPNSPFESNFWYGSNSLWTDLPKDGIWQGLPNNPEGYTQKIFWWRKGYIWNEEPQPDLTVTGERLDASALPLIVSKATNAYASDIGSAMLVGVDFPTLGCWKITGTYADAELSFVVWVAP